VAALIAPSPIETLQFGINKGLLDPTVAAQHIKELTLNPNDRSESLNQLTAKVTVDRDYVQRIKDAVIRGNKKLMHVEQVKRFIILNRDLNQERGELTPTLKVKRKDVEKAFQAELDRIYNEEGYAVNLGTSE